jgi:glutamyl-tRNA reductase
MTPFKTLSEKENKMLLKFPAYISLLAANWNDKLDDVEKESAIKLAHIKTFSCEPLLAEFYKEADKVFEKNIEQLDKDLPKEKEKRATAIELELSHLEKIVSKLGKKYVSVMHNSMKSFKKHVSKAHNSVLVDFIFPISIPGLSE